MGSQSLQKSHVYNIYTNLCFPSKPYSSQCKQKKETQSTKAKKKKRPTHHQIKTLQNKSSHEKNPRVFSSSHCCSSFYIHTHAIRFSSAPSRDFLPPSQPLLFL
ncbi:hypothetical protein TRIATDRAFT_302901 [Trichoderma atroviride IMI 206040]|uniref:Uncharacterized protein n=1 Tax=Hypocrea atroviridis (strain ATCC 20476 / IMI 206040) TaxID=452589 RepID=G9PCD8_HYPAI|nr:uncharacterized protein TRIATDRAFT_302901 [Trichoderma atroviride IMI 206040]EHK39512.1 hypothetical protein TRIATDRAFT_302901 [Trichoderma atroviride IMI 206040]